MPSQVTTSSSCTQCFMLTLFTRGRGARPKILRRDASSIRESYRCTDAWHLCAKGSFGYLYTLSAGQDIILLALAACTSTSGALLLQQHADPNKCLRAHRFFERESSSVGLTNATLLLGRCNSITPGLNERSLSSQSPPIDSIDHVRRYRISLSTTSIDFQKKTSHGDLELGKTSRKK